MRISSIVKHTPSDELGAPPGTLAIRRERLTVEIGAHGFPIKKAPP